MLKQKPSKIDGDLLSQYEEFRQFQSKKKDKKERADDSGNSETPIESMEFQYRRLREALTSDILERVKKCSPQFFERLVINLLVRMGYGGSLKDAGQAIGKSGDGGIDGVIKEDKLGLDNIYVQAKRWADKCVGSLEQRPSASRSALRLGGCVAARINACSQTRVKTVFRPQFWIDLEEGVAFIAEKASPEVARCWHAEVLVTVRNRN